MNAPTSIFFFTRWAFLVLALWTSFAGAESGADEQVNPFEYSGVAEFTPQRPWDSLNEGERERLKSQKEAELAAAARLLMDDLGSARASREAAESHADLLKRYALVYRQDRKLALELYPKVAEWTEAANFRNSLLRTHLAVLATAIAFDSIVGNFRSSVGISGLVGFLGVFWLDDFRLYDERRLHAGRRLEFRPSRQWNGPFILANRGSLQLQERYRNLAERLSAAKNPNSLVPVEELSNESLSSAEKALGAASQENHLMRPMNGKGQCPEYYRLIAFWPNSITGFLKATAVAGASAAVVKGALDHKRSKSKP